MSRLLQSVSLISVEATKAAKFEITGESFSFRFIYLVIKHFPSNVVTIFPNHGDREMNRRILERLGYREYYQRVLKDFMANDRHYVVINLSADVDCDLRVCTNIFAENTRYAEFY